MAEPAPWQFKFGKLELRYGYLLTSRQQWSDCTFVVGSTSERNQIGDQAAVPAHKLILALASPVFEAMFYGGLSESELKDPIIFVPDVQPEVFRALLQYIYTDNVNIDSFDLAWGLRYAAKKYMVPDLVKECNRYISSVGPGLACKTYELASFFEDKILVDKCLEIISTDTKEALNSSFEDCKMSTVITVLSLDHLNVDSELELFQAVARYAKVERKTHGQSICPPADGGSVRLTKSLEPTTFQDKVLLLNVENCSLNSPAVEIDTEKPTGVVTPGQTADNDFNEEGTVPEEPTINSALQKIRFLTLTPEEFEQGPARSGLLTEAESYAVIMNIISRDSAVPMPTGFSECRERRQPRSDSVDEEPNATPRLRPSLKYRGAAMNTPAAIVQGLVSSDIATLKAAARGARVMLSDDPTPQTVAQLVEAGVIPPLVAALDQPWIALQCNAAWALANIASVKKHTAAVVFGGAVPNLVALLECSGEVAEQAAWALGNIAAAGGIHRKAVVDDGALPGLLEQMQEKNQPSSQLTTFLWTYRIICQTQPRLKFELVSPALPIIQLQLISDDEQVLVDACWILVFMTDGPTEQIEAGKFRGKLAERLVALLGHAAPRVRTAALRALGNMLTTTELRDLCLKAGCLDYIINLLKYGTPSDVKEAARAAANLLDGTPLHIQQALDRWILDALAVVLAEGNAECKSHAARAVSNLCSKGTSIQLTQLTAAAALQHYGRLLGERGTRDIVLHGIGHLLRNVQKNKVDAVCQKLQEIGVKTLVINIQQHEERIIVRQAASLLLQKYFREDKQEQQGRQQAAMSSNKK